MKNDANDDASNNSEIFPPPEVERPEEAPVEPEPIPETKVRPSFWSRTLHWLLVVLVIFSLGALLVTLLFYIPLRREMSQREAELRATNQEISRLEEQVRSLSALETENEDLQAQMQRANLHIALLSARADVMTARLALAQDDPTRARVALNQTPETLNSLENLLEPDQQKAANDMQARLELALSGIEENTFAAQSDLNVLATNLLELEHAYFARP